MALTDFGVQVIIYASFCALYYYLAYSTITGDYGYMKYLILFYIIILLEDKHNEQIEKIKK